MEARAPTDQIIGVGEEIPWLAQSIEGEDSETNVSTEQTAHLEYFLFITYGRVFIDSQATKDKNMISTNNFFSTLIFLMPAFSYAQTADMPSLDAFKVGEKWEWVQKDNRTKLVEQKLINTVVSSNGLLKMSNGSSERDILINYTGDPKATKQWRVWPLEIGKNGPMQ